MNGERREEDKREREGLHSPDRADEVKQQNRKDKVWAGKNRIEEAEDNVQEQGIEDRDERNKKDKVYPRANTRETIHQGLNINETGDRGDKESWLERQRREKRMGSVSESYHIVPSI